MSDQKSMVIGKKKLVVPDQNHEVFNLYEQIVNENPDIAESIEGAKIQFVMVEPYVSKTKPIKTAKASEDVQFFSDYNYVIKIGYCYWEKFDSRLKKIMLEHALRHIKTEYDADNDCYKFSVKKHDYSNFLAMISKTNVEDIKTIQNICVDLFANDAGIKDSDDPETVKEKEEKLAKKKEKLAANIEF